MKYPKMFLNAAIEMRAMKTIVATLTTILILVAGTAQASTVGYWRFEEGSADTLAAGTNSILDQTANSNDGTPYGDPFYRIDVPANPVPLTGDTNSLSLELNGNDYVSIPHSTSLDLTDAFTVEFWMKGSISQPSHLYLVIDKSHGWTDSTGWVFQGDSSTGRLGFAVGNGGTTFNNFAGAGSSTSLLDDTWHHIAGTFDSTDTGQEIKLYIDGVLDATGASGPFATNTRNINIGASWGRGSFRRFFNGSVDEIRISDAVLAPSEFLIAHIPALIGKTLKISPNHEFSLEEYKQKTYSIQLINPGRDYRSCALEVVNPYSGLTVSLTHQNPISIAPGKIKALPIVLDAGVMPVGVYDDSLLKLTVEDGETFYSNIKVTIVEQGAGDLPDLSIRSDDIQFTDYTLGESATLKAVIHNKGLSPALNVQVQFYEFGNLLGETVVEEVSANGIGTTSITASITTSGEHLIRVVIDSSEAIEELDETNNEASQIIKIGSPSPIPGNILVTGSLPSTVYTDHLFTISGRAVYDIYVDGTRYTNYVVKGGSVQITIKDDSGNEWQYGGVHTNINGYFSKTLQAPASPGSYHILMTVTDKTFSGKRNLLFSVTNPPTTTPPPPLPPLPPASFSYGNWTYSPITGTWIWTWTTYPTNAPVPETDLRVFSENIHFSKTNPAPDEEITVFAEILYWASSTDLIAQDVPVNFYVTYPGTPRMKIGETVIDRISVGAPDFGSRYVYTTWKNRHEGVYIVEVEIDPNYVEENQLNNAATRAIIVGQIQSFSGVISGQVTDPWGGVGDVIIELYDSSGTTFIENRLTDDTGYYLFENVPVDEYQVHIIKPDGYQVDAETKTAVVSDQSVTEVDFHLTKHNLPVADAGGPYTGSVGSPVTFDAGGSYDPDGEIVSYEWDWDDDGTYDATTSSSTITHTWDTEFSGTIRLKVTDNDGLSAIDIASVEITVAAGLCCDLDGDGDCDYDDYGQFVGAYGKYAGDPGFIPEADYDSDGRITLVDYQKWYECWKEYYGL